MSCTSSPAHIPLLSLVSTLYIFAGHQVLVPGALPEEVGQKGSVLCN